MELTEAVRIDSKVPLVVNDNTFAFIKAVEQLTKAMENLKRSLDR